MDAEGELINDPAYRKLNFSDITSEDCSKIRTLGRFRIERLKFGSNWTRCDFNTITAQFHGLIYLTAYRWRNEVDCDWGQFTYKRKNPSILDFCRKKGCIKSQP